MWIQVRRRSKHHLWPSSCFPFKNKICFKIRISTHSKRKRSKEILCCCVVCWRGCLVFTLIFPPSKSLVFLVPNNLHGDADNCMGPSRWDSAFSTVQISCFGGNFYVQDLTFILFILFIYLWCVPFLHSLSLLFMF